MRCGVVVLSLCLVYIRQRITTSLSANFFDKGIILKGGQAPAHKHIDVLLKYVQEGKVKLDDIITHRLPLSEVAHAYKIFKQKEEDCVKVVMKP